MEHHTYIVEGRGDASLSRITNFLEHTYGLSPRANPDLIVRKYGLLSVEDVRALGSIAILTPITGDTKALVLVVGRVYREAQNALLKLLEEPPSGTVIVLVVPHIATLLPTVLSRVIPLPDNVRNGNATLKISQETHEFLSASMETRTTIIRKLTNGKDEDTRRTLRDSALELMDGIERAIYSKYKVEKNGAKCKVLRAALSDIETLRGHMYDRAAPVRMILEHISLVLPRL